ncbi:hypothetical protein ACEQPO_08575 [Bacillus sp. SL00103]
MAELIWEVYRDTQYLDYVGGMPGGSGGKANLRALYDRAKQYENLPLEGYSDSFVLLKECRGVGMICTAKTFSETEDVVRMMTIHSSKVRISSRLYRRTWQEL